MKKILALFLSCYCSMHANVSTPEEVSGFYANIYSVSSEYRAGMSNNSSSFSISYDVNNSKKGVGKVSGSYFYNDVTFTAGINGQQSDSVASFGVSISF